MGRQDSLRAENAFCSPVQHSATAVFPKAFEHLLISATKKNLVHKTRISALFLLLSMLQDLPAFSKSLHIIQAVTDVISLGLATTVFPHAMAGTIFQVNKYSGKFQGLIKPATKQKHKEDQSAGMQNSFP